MPLVVSGIIEEMASALTFTLLPSYSTTTTANNTSALQPPATINTRLIITIFTPSHAANMSAQSDDNQMQGVQDPSTEGKGKGKAPEADTMQESMDEDSSDESGAEEQVCLPTRKLASEAQPANSPTGR